MDTVSIRFALKTVGISILMSASLTSRSRILASAWATGAVRCPAGIDFRRSFTAIASLTNEKVRAVMEASQKLSTPHLTKADLYRMKTFELQMELSFRGLKSSGDRILLINRLKKVLDETQDESDSSKKAEVPSIDPGHLYVLRTKGHTTHRSGGLGVGLVLYGPDEDGEMWSGRMYVPGDRSLFEAEYSAVILGMEYVYQTLGIRRLLIQTSSDVIVQQIRGVYKVNKESLKILLQREQELEGQFDDFLIEQISATENQVSKELASKALATRKSFNVLLDSNGSLNQEDPIDLLNRTPTENGRWKEADPPSFSATIDPSLTYLLRFDGGSRGNPGITGAGMVLYDDQGQEIWCGWKFHSEAATNNLAEYLGLLCGLKCAKSFGIERLVVEGDSQLVVRQLNGQYQCREESLKKFYNAAREIARDLAYFEIRHIPRSENKRADWLANHAMDLQDSGGFDQIQTEL